MSPYCTSSQLLEMICKTKSISPWGGSYLLAGLVKERIRVDTITDSTSNKGEPVEDQRRLMRALEEQLAQDVDHN